MFNSLQTDIDLNDIAKIDDLDIALSAIAREVVSRGLSTVAIFILEMHKPLVGLIHTAGIIASPLLSVIFGVKKTDKLVGIFQSRENIEKLIVLIEHQQIDYNAVKDKNSVRVKADY